MVRFALVEPREHSTAFVRIGGRIRGGVIAAVVDGDGQTAQRLAETLHASAWATSVEQLHEQNGEAFDAWIAVTPWGLLIAPHNQRPLDARVERWEENAAPWLWGHPFRFLPSVRTAQEGVGSGKIGDTGLLRIHDWRTTSAGDVRHSVLPQLDVACWLVGQAPKVVFAQQRLRDSASGSWGAYLQLHLGFADDRMALIDCSTSLAEGDDYYSLTVIGSTGAVYADDHRNMQLLYGGGHPQAIRTSQGDVALLSAVQEFVDATTKPRAPVCGAPEWRRVQRISAAITASLAAGQAVALDGDLAP